MKVGFEMRRYGFQSSCSSNIIVILLLIFLFNVNKSKIHLNTSELLLFLILVVLRFNNCACTNCRNKQKYDKCIKHDRISHKNECCDGSTTRHFEEDNYGECSSWHSDLAEEIISE